jgi:hypothetical protein
MRSKIITMRHRKSIRIFIASILVLLVVAPAFADEPQTAPEWRGGPHIGFSPYTGIIGAEIQNGHYGLTLGVPTCIGFKYYPDERGYRWFFGLHAMYFSLDEQKTVGNIPYNGSTNTYAGAGFGYRWRWWDHLDLTLSLSATYEKEKQTGSYGNRTDESLYAFPGLTIGGSF